MKVGICGSAFRDESSKRWLTPRRWNNLYDIVGSIIPDGKVELVSGGAAGVDQLAVLFHLIGVNDTKYPLHLALPAKFSEEQQMFEHNKWGDICNFHHVNFSLLMGKDKGFSLRRVGEAIPTATVTIHKGFFARNFVVGDCDLLIAATFTTGDMIQENPEWKGSGGTGHCWEWAKAPRKVLVNLNKV